MMKRWLRLIPVASLTVAAIACGPEKDPGNQPPPLQPIEKTSALTAANDNVKNMLVGGAHASAMLEGSALIGDVAHRSGSCDSTDCVNLGLEPTAQSTADDLKEKVLNVANVETEEEKRIVLKLSPDRVCASDSTSAPDAKCIAGFTQVPVRVELTQRTANNIDVALLVGETKQNPVDLELHTSELAVEIDLGAANKALRDLFTAMGEDTSELPSTMSGRVRLSLTKNAENDYTAAFAVLSAVDVALDVENDHLAFHLGAANPAFSMRLDGNQQQVTMTSNFADIGGELPLRLFFGSSDPSTPPVQGTVRYNLAAAHATSVLHANDESITVDNIDYGSGLEVTIDNKPLLGFDMNVDKITMAETLDGLLITVTPSLLATLSVDFRNIADRVENLPAWTLDDDFSLEMNNAAAPSILVQDQPDAFKVEAGMLTIRSRAAGKSVTVGAGMCLIASDDGVDENANPIELLSSAACPAR